MCCKGLSPDRVERVSITPECEALQQAYLNAGVLGSASADDALHIAIATVMEVDIVLSWNFKHIVHFDKIAGFESVNTLSNYRSPRSSFTAGGHRAVKRKKAYDCVEMKGEIQQKHRQEVETLGKEEAERRRWQRVLDDPVLGGFVRANAPRSHAVSPEGRKVVKWPPA